MATKAEEGIVVGREKKAPSSNSHIITSTKRTTKQSQTTTSSTNKATSTPTEKNSPNYLKPTRSSHLESPSFKQPKSTDAPNNKPNINRRRSFDRPLSSSNLTKQNQPSPSRLHKALVSPGPRERIIPNRPSTTVPVKSTKPSKPISDRTTKNPREGKTMLLYVKKSTPSLSTSTSTKKVANDHASANSTNAAKNNAGTTEGSKVETKEVKEVTEQEVEVKKLENEENYQVEHVSEISPHVDSEHDEHEHDHGLEESDQPHNQANDEKVISTVSEEELKNEPQEEKTEDEHDEEEENTNHDDSNNNGSHPEEQSAFEEEQEEGVVVNEMEDHEDGVIIEDHTSENNNEEEAVVEEKEVVEGGTSEGVVEEAKVEATPLKQLQGKKQSQVSNDVIEETASKLQLEARKNKVRALAGAFQTVIDYQTTSK